MRQRLLKMTTESREKIVGIVQEVGLEMNRESESTLGAMIVDLATVIVAIKAIAMMIGVRNIAIEVGITSIEKIVTVETDIAVIDLAAVAVKRTAIVTAIASIIEMTTVEIDRTRTGEIAPLK
jgi:glutamate mutase epsilon subunit